MLKVSNTYKNTNSTSICYLNTKQTIFSGNHVTYLSPGQTYRALLLNCQWLPAGQTLCTDTILALPQLLDLPHTSHHRPTTPPSLQSPQTYNTSLTPVTTDLQHLPHTSHHRPTTSPSHQSQQTYNISLTSVTTDLQHTHACMHARTHADTHTPHSYSHGSKKLVLFKIICERTMNKTFKQLRQDGQN